MTMSKDLLHRELIRSGENIFEDIISACLHSKQCIAGNYESPTEIVYTFKDNSTLTVKIEAK